MSEKDKCIFDIEAFEKCFDGDKKFAKELIQAFLDEFPLRLAELKKGIFCKNIEDIDESTHSMKGLLANMGAEDIASIAKSIELAAKDKDFDKIKETTSYLNEKIDELIITFNDYLA